MGALPWLVLSSVLCLQSLGPFANAAEDNGPCTSDVLKVVRENSITYGADILEHASNVIEPNAETNGEHFLLLLSRDLCHPLLGMFEAFYLQICHLSHCKHCAFEVETPTTPGTPWFPAEARLEPKFELLAERLVMFTEVFESAVDLHDIEEERRRSTSPLPERRKIVSAMRRDVSDLRDQALPAKLDHHFTRSVEDPDNEEVQGKLLETVVLGRNLLAVLHNQVTEALGLIPLLAAEARHLPGLQTGFGHEPYVKYLTHSSTSTLDSFALLQGARRPAWSLMRTSALCDRDDPPLVHASPLADRPHQDGSGTLMWNGATAHALLGVIARSNRPLSYTYWTVRPATHFGKDFSCQSATGLFFDAAPCLDEKGWGGSVYYVNPDPKPREKERLYIQWRGRAWNDERSKENPLWKAFLDPLTPPSEPMDVLSLSPLAGNCELLRKLLTADSMTMARLVYAPINPVVPPPLETEPNYTEFWVGHRTWSKEVKKRAGGKASQRLEESAVRYFLSQCSLERVHRILRPLGYELMHVEHLFAVFAHHSVARLLRRAVRAEAGEGRQQPSEAAAPPTTFDAWRAGWYCAPLSRYMLDLEVRSPFDTAWLGPQGGGAPSFCAFLAQHDFLSGSELASSYCGAGEASDGQAPARAPLAGHGARPGELKPQVRQRQRAVWAVVPAHPALRISELLRTAEEAQPTQRVACDDAPTPVCACLPPYRGSGCDVEDGVESDSAKPYRAAITYVLAGCDHSADLLDLAHSLTSLWKHFNSRHDYPVLIFHGGLDREAKEQLALTTASRVWFLPVPSLCGGDDGFVQHFKTLMLFRHPAVSGLDFLWNLDASSYLPADVKEDPFEMFHRVPSLVLAYRRLARLPDSADGHRQIWERTQLYFLDRGLEWDAFAAAGAAGGPSSLLGAVLANEPGEPLSQPTWNRHAISTDCEVLRVGFLSESSHYADYVSFVDAYSGDGAGRYDAAVVRTLGVAVAGWFESAETHTLELQVPYSRHDLCFCGGSSGPSQDCVRGPPDLPQAEFQGTTLAGWPPDRKVWTCGST